MPWLKVSDDAATFPALMSVMGQAGADERLVNEVAGFIFRLATLSGGHMTDYVVDTGTCFMIGGARTQELIKICVTAGLLAPTEAFGGKAVKLVEDDHFFHMRTKEEVEFERQRNRDNKDPRLTVPVRQRDGDNCRYCAVRVQWRGRTSSRTATYDHREPGQAATVETLVVACVKCNSARQDNPQWDDDNPLLPVPAKPFYGKATVKFLADNGVTVVQDDSQVDPGSVDRAASVGPVIASNGNRDSRAVESAAVDPGSVDRAASVGPGDDVNVVDPGTSDQGASVGPAFASELVELGGASASVQGPVVEQNMFDPGISRKSYSPDPSLVDPGTSDQGASVGPDGGKGNATSSDASVGLVSAAPLNPEIIPPKLQFNSITRGRQINFAGSGRVDISGRVGSTIPGGESSIRRRKRR